MQWLKLGVVGRAHGLRGSFFVSGRDEAIPSTVKLVRIGADPETAVAMTIESRQWQNGRAAIKCAQVDDRTAAERWTGQVVWVDAEHIAVDDHSEYLLKDLMGRTVLDDSGVEMGSVDDVYVTAAGVNLVVLNPEKTSDVEIPMIATYIDMKFQRGGSELRLVVPRETFEEVWNPRGRKS